METICTSRCRIHAFTSAGPVAISTRSAPHLAVPFLSLRGVLANAGRNGTPILSGELEATRAVAFPRTLPKDVFLDVERARVEPLLSELMMYKNGLLAEQEEQCRTFLKMTQCWLK